MEGREWEGEGMIDAAIVGLGRWGRTLVAAVQGKSGRLRFTRAVVRDAGRHRDFAEQHGLALSGDLGGVVADPAIDAVVLATPHSLHCEQILMTAAAGKHVFCEKPLTLTKAEAARVIAACRKAGVVLGIGHDKRFFPSLRELALLAKNGALGQILHIEGHFSNEVAGSFAEWRFSPEESPAGGMTGTGIHMLDMMVSLLGPVRRVQALLMSHKPPPDPLDSLSVLLEFRSKASGTLAAVRSSPTFMRLHAFGRNASAEALSVTQLVVRRSGAAAEHLDLPPAHSVAANLEAFAEAAAGGAAYPIPPNEIFDTVAAFEAIAKAVELTVGPARSDLSPGLAGAARSATLRQ
jgi:predicted dehydrogenase